MDRPTSTASSSVAAPRPRWRPPWWRPRRRRAAARPGRRRPTCTAAANARRSAVTPDAPLAMSSTVSLVDMQPSASMRSKVDAARGPQRSVERGRSTIGVGGDHAEHGGQARGEHAGALGHAADGPAVRDGRAATAWPRCRWCGWRRPRRPRRRRTAPGPPRSTPGEQRRHRQPFTDEPGRADRDVAGTDSELRRRRARRCGACRRIRPGRYRRWRRRS